MESPVTSAPDRSVAEPQRFGTFLGVYTPSILTILGLIMYLRFGWVVGNLGLGLTLVVVLLATSITFITGLSVSAIATNMKVGVGGEYFLVSRSLGLELGGAIGIPLYLCRALSLTFYCFGLAEAVLIFWPAAWGALPTWMIQAVAAGFIIVITLLAGKSAGLVLKLQIPIMVIVGASITALAIGVFKGGLQAPSWTPTFQTAPQGFWYVFAVFFPAVTGFTAGVGMSGDLRDPQRSIPRGTLGAVLTGCVIYLVVPVLFSVAVITNPEMLATSGIESWTRVAVFGGLLIYPAIWGAILSSAFGSALSGPRVLQALAQDGLAPSFMSRLSRTGQPTLATWITGSIALAAVALGSLNTLAQFVSILFLTLYVMLNFSSIIEKLVDDPSFRPSIKVPWQLALLGMCGALFVMFLVSPVACVVAVLLELIVYALIRRQSLQKRWGDVWGGFWLVLTQFSLLRLRRHGHKPRNWRPRILLLVGDTRKRLGLMRLAGYFTREQGLLTATNLIVGDLTAAGFDEAGALAEMRRDIRAAELTAFCEAIMVPDFEVGAVCALQAEGSVWIKPNTVMFGWSGKPDRLESHLRIARAAARVGRSTIITRLNWEYEPGQRKNIHLWWGGQQRNGDLMLLLAYLLRRSDEWRDSHLTIRTIVDDEDQQKSMLDSMRRLIPQSRITAESEVIVRRPDQSIPQIIHQHSRDATMTFLGFPIPEPGKEQAAVAWLREVVAGLRTTVLVHNPGVPDSVPEILQI